MVCNDVLFPMTEDKDYLTRQDFFDKMADCNYVILKPNDLRKKFTEYVYQNKARAQMPSKPLPRKTDPGVIEK